MSLEILLHLPLVLLYLLLALLPLALIAALLGRVRAQARSGSVSPGLKRISKTSGILVFFGGAAYRTACYFDADRFVMKGENGDKTIPLHAIRAVTRTRVEINGRSLWKVLFDEGGETGSVEFLHNFTVFNRDFVRFLVAVERASPTATVDKLTLFTL
ncbi:hypothetical protein SAMN05216588_107205 [Pseudomonas flavescens]|uniref:Uncharacterized protein n=1 Tax=Phytopseudomonas flavescens TaxID=29435 RepID=A0A1G8FAU9_9GAMM|nr:hypothetical protein [Pseudomonas flavescens]SDH79228.1 hypothetical protein SAMN05216588_107205 [Pseudomonas flavescens]